MGRGRSSTNYTDAEKQTLLRAVAAIKPRRASCWHAIASHYNAHRGGGNGGPNVVARDAHSLKRKFKTMANARAPRDGVAEDPYDARAKQLQQQMKNRIATLSNGGEYEEEEDEDEEEEAQTQTIMASEDDDGTGVDQRSATTATSASPAFSLPQPRERARNLPSLAPLLPHPTMPTQQHQHQQAPARDRAGANAPATRASGSSDSSIGSELAQLLLVIRDENAQREATRRAERAEALTRDERLRDEAREQRRLERDEAAARDERFWREMAEQRRRDREDAAARHEQMMVLLAAVVKAPST